MELDIAPKAVFDQLPVRASRPRFMLRNEAGDWKAKTWQSFADDIQHAAMFLRDVGIDSESRVAIFSPNCIAWMSAALGAQAVGGVMVPIYPTSTADQAAYVFEHSDADVLFVDTESLVEKVLVSWSTEEHGFERAKRVVIFGDVDPAKIVQKLQSEDRFPHDWSRIQDRFIRWETAMEIGRARHQENPKRFFELMNAVSLDQMAVMLYTSGTTGRPKGVPLTHRNIAVNGHDWLSLNGDIIDQNSVDILWLPMSHIFGFGEACLGNALGFVSYVSDPMRVLDDLKTVKPNIFMSVPRFYEKIAGAVQDAKTFDERQRVFEEVTGGNLAFCLSGGAGLKVEVKELFLKHGVVIIEGYGLTEASPTLTMNRVDDFRFDSVGKPFPSVEIRIAEDGEILAQGENVFGGYHKDAAASAAVFENGWLKTGDLGRFTEDGFLQIIGRKKEILVTAGGKNVSPVNIEQRFLDDARFAHVVVYGDGEKYLVAGVWPATDLEVETIQTKVEEVNSSLARYETIKKFVVMGEPLTVDNGFLTPTLKVKRNRVYAHFGEMFQELYQ